MRTTLECFSRKIRTTMFCFSSRKKILQNCFLLSLSKSYFRNPVPHPSAWKNLKLFRKSLYPKEGCSEKWSLSEENWFGIVKYGEGGSHCLVRQPSRPHSGVPSPIREPLPAKNISRLSAENTCSLSNLYTSILFLIHYNFSDFFSYLNLSFEPSITWWPSATFYFLPNLY